MNECRTTGKDVKGSKAEKVSQKMDLVVGPFQWNSQIYSKSECCLGGMCEWCLFSSLFAFHGCSVACRVYKTLKKEECS